MESKETQALTDRYCWFTSLKQAIVINRRDAHNRYLQLATVRADGTPAVRTLVFRALQQEPAQLAMVTDSRSQKTAEIVAQPAGEICWYFSRTREQFRLRGTLSLTGADNVDQTRRKTIWSAMSAAAREQFYWPHPKRPLNDRDKTGKANSERNSNAGYNSHVPAAMHAPPENFLILSLQIESVDHLCLRGEPQTRSLSWLDSRGIWANAMVNP